MNPEARKVIVIGGGAAGFFGAISAAENGASVILLEKSSQFLAKVRISGGGRCNVTHACFETRELSRRYPRGSRALIGPFSRFQPSDTMSWFQQRGVDLKVESDGRVFPKSDSSQTIIDCLIAAAKNAGVELRTNAAVTKIERENGDITVHTGREILHADAVLIAVGGTRSGDAARLASGPGHSMEAPVPSLFTFEIDSPLLRATPGVVAEVEASIPGTKLRERGPLLVTHWGVSGPAILRLSAWGARELSQNEYHFSLHINWLGGLPRDTITARLQALRLEAPGRQVANLSPDTIPARLWEQLVRVAKVPPGTTWNRLTREHALALGDLLFRNEFTVTGKSLNKDEFVTCGGVALPGVDFRSMESRIWPGMFFAGEVLDIDGITGGFNFQAAWTTGWIAGKAMATASRVAPEPNLS